MSWSAILGLRTSSRFEEKERDGFGLSAETPCKDVLRTFSPFSCFHAAANCGSTFLVENLPPALTFRRKTKE
jgi:hypothetical protein